MSVEAEDIVSYLKGEQPSGQPARGRLRLLSRLREGIWGTVTLPVRAVGNRFWVPSCYQLDRDL